MRFAVSFNIFDLEADVLYASIQALRKHADYINIVTQSVSNNGKLKQREEDAEFINWLLEKRLVNNVIHYNPFDSMYSEPVDRELEKRNIGLMDCVNNGAELFLTADSDELYPSNIIGDTIELMCNDSSIWATYLPIRTYYKTLTHYYIDDFNVPFIYRLFKESPELSRLSVPIENRVDQTRAMSFPLGKDMLGPCPISNQRIIKGYMEHYSYYRRDITLKLATSTCSENFYLIIKGKSMFDTFIEHWNKWKPNDSALIFYHATILMEIPLQTLEKPAFSTPLTGLKNP
jgi:hypothetical protein